MFLLLSIVIGCFVFAPVFRFYVQISGQVGQLATLFGESGIIVISILVLYLFDKRTKGFLDEKTHKKEKD